MACGTLECEAPDVGELLLRLLDGHLEDTQ
jgi:hypothetical protein